MVKGTFVRNMKKYFCDPNPFCIIAIPSESRQLDTFRPYWACELKTKKNGILVPFKSRQLDTFRPSGPVN